ncbi:MAG: hypothetical protein IKH44_14350 [Bacteroidales bacterium]|nr:hypothetical protein [Bacteroidales bacterium]
MDREIRLLRLKELKAALEDIDKRLHAMDDLLVDDVPDDVLKKCFVEVKQILAEREPLFNEIRCLLMMEDDDDIGINGGRGMVN